MTIDLGFDRQLNTKLSCCLYLKNGMASWYYQGPGAELGSGARGHTRESDDAHDILATSHGSTDTSRSRRSGA